MYEPKSVVRRYESLLLFRDASLLLLLLTSLVLGCAGGGGPSSAIRITSGSATLAAGTTLQLTASETTLGITSDVSSSAIWTSSNAAVATVSSTGLVTGVAAGSAVITATIGKVSGSTSLTIGSPAASSLALTPTNTTVVMGSTQTYVATATYANHTTAVPSSGVTWSVQPATIATISQTGVLTPVSPGSFSVSATYESVQATASGIVTASTLNSITVTPAAPSISGGNTQQFTATGNYSDATTADLTQSVTWSSSNTTLLPISSTGLATASTDTASTAVTITAQLATITGTSTAQVVPPASLTSLYVEPTSSSIAVGSAEPHTATAFYSDGTQKDVTNQVTWSAVSVSGNTSVRPASHVLAQANIRPHPEDDQSVTVNQSGTDTAQSPGTSMVQASMGSMQSQSTVIVTTATVTSIAIRATKSLFPVGATQQIQLIGTFSDGSTQDLSLTANWQSSDPTIATIDQTGMATGVKAGNIQFTGSFGGLTASTTGYEILPSKLVAITASIPYAILVQGVSEPLTVIGTYSDGSTHDVTQLASWSSADSTVFPVDSTGLAYALNPGETQITATVNGHSGLVDVVSTSVTLQGLQILEPNTKFALGTTIDFTVLATFTGGAQLDLSTAAIWTSADPTVMTIDGNGRAKSGKLGTTTVSATILGQTAVSIPITVTNATLTGMHITETWPTIAASTSSQFQAYGLFSDGSLQILTPDVLWTSSDPTIASIDTNGQAIGIKGGQVQITATCGTTIVTLPLTITNATLVAVNLTPPDAEIPVLVKRQYTLMGTFSDGSTQPLANDIIWVAPTPSIAEVVLNGQVLAISPGVGSLTAQRGYFSASTPINVTNTSLTSITLTPASTTIRQGQFEQMTATGTFGDGFSMSLNNINAVFSSSNPAIVNIGAEDVAFGGNVGSVTMSASFQGLTASTTTFQVLSSTLTSIMLSPAQPTVTIGGTQQLTAIGTFADGSTGDVSSMVTWTSSNPAALSVDENGLSTAYTAGAVTVTATWSGANQSVAVTVLAAGGPTLSSIAVSPANSNLVAGSTEQLTATGTYSDASTANITNSVTWSSSNSGLASISNTGLVTGVAAGSVNLEAQLSGQQSFASVAVSPSNNSASLNLTGITVLPTSTRIAQTTSTNLSAIGTYSDGSTQDISGQVTWSSGSNGVATVSVHAARGSEATANARLNSHFTSNATSNTATNSTGTVTGIAPGLSNVQAQIGSFSSNSAVVVTPATLTSIAISPSGASFAPGSDLQFTLTGTFSDGSMQNLTPFATWSSSAPSVAAISPSGLAIGETNGSVSFTSTYGGMTATTPTVTITSAILDSVAITPSSPSLGLDSSQQFTVFGIYSDGTAQNLTDQATFTSSTPTTATISPTGVGFGLSAGTATFTANVNGHTATTGTVTVTPATLVSIAVSPNSPSLAKGGSQQFSAIGTFSDGTTQDITAQAVWTSSNPQVLTINQYGLASSDGTGSATITATLNGVSTTTANVNVTPATLTGLTLSPTSAQIAKGTTQQFTATGTYTDGTTQNLSTSVTWSSSNGAVASISASGAASGLGVGNATVSAAYQGKTVSTSSFLVTQATLVSIAFSPASPTVAVGSSTQVNVIGTFSDGTTQNLSSTATYSSSNTAAVSVGGTGLLTGIAPGNSTITATVNGTTSSFVAAASTATLSSIAITPVTPASMAKGTTQQFTATATYTDGSTQNLTSTATWTSSTSSVFTVNSTGLVTAVSLGSSQLTASYQGKTATTPSFQVTAATVASIAVTPSSISIISGATQQFTATATYTDSTTQNVSNSAAWSTSSSTLLTISGTGLATAGSTSASSSVTVNAQYASINGSVQATVNPIPAPTLTGIIVGPTSAHAAANTVARFTAKGTYSDGSTADLTNSVTWSSSNNAEAIIGSNGLAVGVAPGTVTLSATSGSVSNQAVLVVTNATLSSIAISPSGASFAAGSTQQFTLTGTFSDGSTQDVTASATWSTSASAVASISATGLASAVAAGSVQFTASYGGMTATTAAVTITAATLTSVALSPTNPTFANLTSQQFTLTGTYSDGTTENLTNQATFTSSNTAVLRVSSTGLGMSLTPGSAQITATVNGLTATTQSVTVTSAVLTNLDITPDSPTFAAGTNQQFDVIGTFSDGTTQDLSTQVVWTSSNPQVLTINQNGLASSDGTGTADITATLNGVSTTTNDATVTQAVLTALALSPTTAQIAKGTTQQFTVTGTYSDGSTQNLSSEVTWSSSNGAIVSVSATGVATGTGAGSAQITATYQGQSVSTSSFQVSPATLVSIAFSPANPSVAAGSSTQVNVIGTFSDGSTQNLSSSSTYTSSNPSAITISNAGLITGVAPGNSTVTVSVSGVTSSFTATVSNATLSSIAITPTNPSSLANGTTEQFTATGTYSDSSTQTITTEVTWASSNTAIFTVNTTGLVTGQSIGSAQLTASYQGKTATTPAFQVTAATLASLAVTPSPASIAVSATQQFVATGTYTDGTTQNLSSSATWSSSSSAIATITSTGLATAAGVGTTNIEAQIGSINNTASLNVTSAPVTGPTVISMAISPANASLTAGNTVQYTATATYSDSSTKNVSSSATWSSSSTAIATINTAGLAKGIAAGSTTIAATLSGVSASTTLTVSTAPVTLQSVTITPSSATVAKGSTQQFTLTANYSDSSTLNVTNSATWSSSTSSVASVTSTGLATGEAAGNTLILASYQNKSANVNLVVGNAVLTSIAVTPASVTLAAGTTQQYKAIGTMSDGGTQNLTTSVTWSSNNTSATTINSSGLATTHAVGNVTITATSGSIQSTATMTVTAATPTSIQISPTSVSLAVNNSQQLLVTATFSDGSSQNVTSSATYSSSTASVATISSGGNVTGVAPGTTTITASLGNVSANSTVTITGATLTSIAITPSNPSLPVGLSQQLTATGTYSDGSTQDLTNTATWSSSASSVASVSSTGNVVVGSTGSATITATSGTVSGTDTVTGTSAVVTAIAVSPASVTLAAGQTQQFAATATLSDGSQQTVTASAHWSVSNPSFANVSNTSGSNGFLTSTAAGTTSVTATINSTSGSATVTVQAATLNSIAVTPNPLSLPAGTNQSLTVTGTYSDGSTANLTASATFSSASSSIAAVNSTGLVSGVSTGNTTITATVNGVSGTTAVTVTSVVLQSIAITPATTSIALGLHAQLAATGTYSDGSTQDITSQVQWSSSAPSKATVSSTGLISTLATGSSTITATLNSLSATASLTVTAAVLQSIAVTAPQTSFALGLSLQLTATGTYSDGTTQNLTSSVTWSSQTPSVGVVSSTGVATGHTTGTFNAVATSGGISGTLGITVTSAVLVSIAVSPNNVITVNLNGIQFTATGTFSDGSTQNLTDTVHWALSGIALGSISSTGLYTPTLGISVQGTVTATSGSIVGTATVTIL